MLEAPALHEYHSISGKQRVQGRKITLFVANVDAPDDRIAI